MTKRRKQADYRVIGGTPLRHDATDKVTGRAQFGADVRRVWTKVVEEKRPVRGCGNLWIPGREHVKWEGIAMPLAEDDRTVNMLLGGVLFDLGRRA